MPDKDVDEQFAAIMAHWQEEAIGLDPSGDPEDPRRPDRQRWPAPPAPGPAERLGPAEAAQPAGEDHAPDGRPDLAAPPQPTPPQPTPPVLGAAWRQHHPVEEELHFEPPPPAPLPPAEDKHFWTMLSALVGGPLLFLYLLLFNRDGNGWWMTFAILISVAGFVLLVLRQPAVRDDGDDGIRL